MNKKDNAGTSITKEQIKSISERAAEVAIEKFKSETEKYKEECRDRRLYNTRLLMEKYRGLIVYCNDAIHSANQIDDDYELSEIIAAMSVGKDSYTLSVDSIRERAGKTRIILDHINNMLNFYEAYCTFKNKPETARKWIVVKSLYLDEEKKTVQELAEMLYVDERTIYRYNKAALQDISALLFGCIE